ncbi:MAG: hypothetical protein ACE15C_00800 [Phycisphaerae bacterium]
MNDEDDSDWAAQAIGNADTPDDLKWALTVIRKEDDFALDRFERISTRRPFKRYVGLLQEMMLRMRDKHPEYPSVPTSEDSVDYVNWCVSAAGVDGKAEAKDKGKTKDVAPGARGGKQRGPRPAASPHMRARTGNPKKGKRAQSGKRRSLSREDEVALWAKCRRRCCLCFVLDRDDSEKKGQFAHIDHDHSNNSKNNFVWLCLHHHDSYDSRTSQTKNYTQREVRSYQAKLYNAMKRPAGRPAGRSKRP